MTVLVLAWLSALALAITFAAKWQETRQEIADERREWFEKVARLEYDKEILLEGGRHDAEALLWYAEKLAAVKEEMKRSRAGNAALQDKLSAILCPTANHVWVDGVCKKCGRVQDAEIH